MFHPRSPGGKRTVAEAATTLDIGTCSTPGIEVDWGLGTGMELAQMLPQIVFPTKGTLSCGLFKTYMELVFIPMSRRGKRSVAERASSDLGGIVLLKLFESWRTDPVIQLKMDALLMP
jgi:hypothetical protein